MVIVIPKLGERFFIDGLPHVKIDSILNYRPTIYFLRKFSTSARKFS